MSSCLKILGFYLGFGLFQLTLEAQATDRLSNKRIELKTVQSQISATHKNLSQLQDQQLDVHEQLTEIDKQCAQLAVSLKDVQEQIDLKNHKLQESQSAVAQQRKAIDTQKKSLAEQLNAAHRIGKHDHLKLLLNQEDLALSSRVLVYFDYLNKIRSQKLNQIAVELEQLTRLELQQEQDSLDLSEALKQKKLAQAQLLKMKRARTLLLEQIKGKYSAGQQALRHLQEDERRLVSLLDILQRDAEKQRKIHDDLKRKAAQRAENKLDTSTYSNKEGAGQRINEKVTKQADVASSDSLREKNAESESQNSHNEKKIQNFDAFVSGKAFHQLRGQLAWPSQGKFLKTFGSARSEGRWDGVLIGAPTGQKVRVVAEGRVVYAAWLRSYGLLMIVNHGGGFMTVYAFNDSLYKAVGAKVKAGEVIASVGQSGGQLESGLYFEIRERGKPLDPFLWCKK